MVNGTKFIYDGKEKVGCPQLLANWQFKVLQAMYLRTPTLEQRRTDFRRGKARNYIAALQGAKVNLLKPWMLSFSFTFVYIVNESKDLEPFGDLHETMKEGEAVLYNHVKDASVHINTLGHGVRPNIDSKMLKRFWKMLKGVNCRVEMQSLLNEEIRLLEEHHPRHIPEMVFLQLQE
ncbi:hypothetical protein QAD02_017619 [Eretmocerus hayati]|uniref:Uncharacterized protein n=1 Tax=Eretmocerus hayati TaxID=131215 RepID=A0ACC2PED8_9HYME|nr:hypothetical protein QAD02_017619 [Eretmocerus hayati]